HDRAVDLESDGGHAGGELHASARAGLGPPGGRRGHRNGSPAVGPSRPKGRTAALKTGPDPRPLLELHPHAPRHVQTAGRGRLSPTLPKIPPSACPAAVAARLTRRFGNPFLLR